MAETKQVKELVHFTADWCQPCKRMEPVIQEFILENPDIKYHKVDIEKDTEDFDYFNKKYHIMSVPTFMGFVDQKLIDVHVGIASSFILKSLLG